ncbi:PepSY domain-containing protein [Stutzerimonas frequens]|uniref:PepSY domain-containing protein n=1 Tax=Stutzerimonas frequens TaxID=2968969 RepID=UPI0022DDAAA9|nr:PepSY domain-containing protein [Stutzerimonas frequens]MDA0423642.1 PepSY domain-containing protein [Stutzerimonas frequens]
MSTGADALAAEQTDVVTGARSIDLVRASEIARRELGGEIIKAELTRYQGAEVYMVRLLDDGRVREVLVDASTGDMFLPGKDEETE